MAWFINLFILIAIISASQALELFGSPNIQGLTKIIYGKSNVKLVLICKSDAPAHWHLPNFLQKNFNHDSGITSRVQVDNFEEKEIHKKNYPGYRYKTTLTIKPAWLDTGNYVCHYKTNDTTLHMTNDKNQRYVYFQDDNNLLVRPKGYERNVMTAVEFAPIVVPCKPSDPNVTMLLYHRKEQVYPFVIGSNWRFDPQEGFKMNMMRPDTYGQYTCVAEKGSKNETLMFYINIGVGAPQPLVNTKSLANTIAAGNEFHLSCSVSYVAGRDVKLEWIVPNPKGIDGARILVGKLGVKSESIDGLNMTTANRDIRVKRAQDLDQGRYICRSYDRNQTQEAETFVMFYNYPFMKVSSKNLKVGDPFTVKCHVTNCGSQTAELSFMECPPSERCTNKWMKAYPNGLNEEVVYTSSTRLLDTVTIIGRAKVSGLYKCKSTCYNNSFMKEIVVSDQAVIYSAAGENVRVTEGGNIYLFCRARTLSKLAVQWYKDGDKVTKGVIEVKNGSSLLIESAIERDSGSYRCQFSNSDSRTMNVSVKPRETSLFSVFLIVLFSIVGVLIVVVCFLEFFKRRAKLNLFKRSEVCSAISGKHSKLSQSSIKHPFADLKNDLARTNPGEDDEIDVALVSRSQMPLPKSPTVAENDEDDYQYYANCPIVQSTKIENDGYVMSDPKNNLKITETSHYATLTEGVKPRPVTFALGDDYNNEVVIKDWNERNDPTIAYTNPAYEKNSEEDELQSYSTIYSDAITYL